MVSLEVYNEEGVIQAVPVPWTSFLLGTVPWAEHQ